MSFVKVNGNNFEYTGVELHPEVHYISSSIGLGMTGSVKVSATENRTVFIGGPSIQETMSGTFLTQAAAANIKLGQPDALINGGPDSLFPNKEIPIFRVDPSFVYTGNTTIKNHVRNVLMPHHAIVIFLILITTL